MRIIDTDRKHSVRNVQLYLSDREARELHRQLGSLLADVEANEHFHVLGDDFSREISCSIVTHRKLAQGSYTTLEHKVFDEK